MAIGGIQGAQLTQAISGLRGVNAQTQAFGQGISESLQGAEQIAGAASTATASSNAAAGPENAAPVADDTSRVQPAAPADGSRGTLLDISV